MRLPPFIKKAILLERCVLFPRESHCERSHLSGFLLQVEMHFKQVLEPDSVQVPEENTQIFFQHRTDGFSAFLEVSVTLFTFLIHIPALWFIGAYYSERTYECIRSLSATCDSLLCLFLAEVIKLLFFSMNTDFSQSIPVFLCWGDIWPTTQNWVVGNTG